MYALALSLNSRRMRSGVSSRAGLGGSFFVNLGGLLLPPLKENWDSARVGDLRCSVSCFLSPWIWMVPDPFCCSFHGLRKGVPWLLSWSSCYGAPPVLSLIMRLLCSVLNDGDLVRGSWSCVMFFFSWIAECRASCSSCSSKKAFVW